MDLQKANKERKASKQVGRNNTTFFIRIILPFLMIWFFNDAFRYILDLPFEKSTIPMIVLICVLHLFIVLFLIIGLLYRTSAMSISENELIAYNLLGTARTICITDIIGFSTTTYLPLIVKGYNGLYLYLVNGKVVEITEYNIKTIKPLHDVLFEKRIKYLGHEMSWFPFRPLRYKFLNK